jgi:ABC-type oligopeptide transport system substrate-binding subunit
VSPRLGGLLVVLVAGATLLVASSLAGTTVEAPKGGTLRIASFDDVDHVDTALAYLTDSWLLQYATCAKLFNHPDASGAGGARVIPEVVQSFAVSRDGRTYTFTLKDSFRFHTGASVTAQSFADAFNRNAQPKLASPAAAYMREIVGARAVMDGDARTISGVRVLDRYRLQIRLTRPLGDFTARLTMPFFCPILPNTPIDPKGIDNPAGSGPYFVAERTVNQRIVLRRNPHYRGGRPANVDEIEWTIGATLQECQRAVEDDRVDFCGVPGAAPAASRALADQYGVNRPGGRLFVRPSLATWALVFNHARPAFRGTDQIPLKKAINFAIDRPAMVRPFGYLGGKRTDQLLPPPLARAEKLYPLGGADVRTAQRWYARARFKPTRLVYYTAATPAWVEVAQILRFDLAQLGIDLEVKYFSLSSLAEKAETPGEPFDLVNLGWSIDYADAATFFVPLLGRDGIRTGINLDDARLQRRIDAANRLTGEARARSWADLDVDVMRDNPPWAPFMHIQSRILVSPSVGCVVLHPVIAVDITALCKRR